MINYLQEELIYYVLEMFDQMIISTIKSEQAQQLHKMLQRGQYKTYSYLNYSEEDYFFKHNLALLRRQTSLIGINRHIFQPSLSHTVINAAQQPQHTQKYILTKTTFTEQTNLIRLLNIPKYIDKLPPSTLISQVVIALILKLMVSTNYQIYVWDDVSLRYEEQRGEISVEINQGARTGMDFLLFECPINFRDFSRIYEVVQMASIETKHGDNKFSFQMKIRSIAKILLNLLIRRKFQLLRNLPDYKTISDNTIMPISKCLAILEKRRELFKNLLENTQILASISSMQQQIRVNYLQFLRNIFVQQKFMEWSEVIDLLVPKKQNFILPKHRKLVSFDKIVKNYQLSYIKNQQQEYKDNVKKMGLDKDPRVFLLAMMSLQTSYAKQAISYPDLNTLFQDRIQLNYQIKDELFSFYSKVRAKASDLNRPENREQKNNESWQSKQQELIQLQSEGANTILDQQIDQFLNALSQNYGRFSMQIKRSNFVTQNYYSGGFKKYNYLFK